MKTCRFPGSFRVLLLGCLAMVLRAHAGPEYVPNMVLESSAPGLARLEVLLSPKEWKESRRFGKGPIPPVAVLDTCRTTRRCA
jgi:hypothetical protein